MSLMVCLSCAYVDSAEEFREKHWLDRVLGYLPLNPTYKYKWTDTLINFIIFAFFLNKKVKMTCLRCQNHQIVSLKSRAGKLAYQALSNEQKYEVDEWQRDEENQEKLTLWIFGSILVMVVGARLLQLMHAV